MPVTLLLTTSLAAFLWATRMTSRWIALLLALLAGFVCSLAASFKLTALPAVLFFSIVYTLFYRGPDAASVADPQAPPAKRRWFNFSGPLRAMKVITLAGLIAGAAPLMVAMSLRCTRINDNKFCLVCSNAPQNFLLGHYGRIQSITWKSGGGAISFGSPAQVQHGYTVKKEVPFALNDAEKNNAEGWKWMRENPAEAVIISLEHVFDAFGGSVAWPPNVTFVWMWSEMAQYGFLVFLLLPSLWLCVDIAKKRGLAGFLASTECLILSPSVGLVASVAVATGEARYRIPFDGLFIIVGVAFYNRYIVNRSQQALGADARPLREETVLPDLVGIPDAVAAPELGAAEPELGAATPELGAPAQAPEGLPVT
jgi:hypothetical protein